MDSRFIDTVDDSHFASQCARCIHKVLNASSCAAFQKGIPSKILSGQFDHRFPFDGDNGIRYEPVEEAAEI